MTIYNFVHNLTIPDELLAWGKRPEVAKTFLRPWAHDLERVMSGEQPLGKDATEKLLARLEALCAEAARAGRSDLLLGLDIFTAEWIGLTYTVRLGAGAEEKRFTVGRRGDWSYQELRTVLDATEPSEAAVNASRCKDLVAEAFPQARIGAIIDARNAACADCGRTDALMMMTLESGNRYCGDCWSYLISPWPVIDRYWKKTVRAV